MNTFIIHGTNGNPDEHWFQWLKAKLEKLGHEVYVPQFPGYEQQNLDNWLKVISIYNNKLDDSIIIAHSVGCAFVLDVIELLDVKPKCCFLVAGFTGPLHIDYDAVNKTLAERDFDWAKIKENCSKFVIYQSTDDPYVPVKKGEELAANLGSELIMVKDADHFGAQRGYDRFVQLLEDIEKLFF